jgi:hypothetical protein
MLYIPSKQLKVFERGTQAWAKFKELSKQLARLNAENMKSKGRMGHDG